MCEALEVESVSPDISIDGSDIICKDTENVWEVRIRGEEEETSLPGRENSR